MKADMIASPSGMLEGGAFRAAISAAGSDAEFVSGGIWPPADDRHSASKRRVMLAALAPQPTHAVDRCSSPSVGRGPNWRMSKVLPHDRERSSRKPKRGAEGHGRLVERARNF